MDDLPIIAGGSTTGPGGDSRPGGVSALEQSAMADLAAAESTLDALAESIEEEAADDLARSEAAFESTILDHLNSYVKDLAKAEKGADAVLDAIYAEASDLSDRANIAITGLGGEPVVMTGEAVAILETGDPFAEAMNRIIMPALDQQMRDATVGTADDVDTRSQPPPPPPVPSGAMCGPPLWPVQLRGPDDLSLNLTPPGTPGTPPLPPGYDPTRAGWGYYPGQGCWRLYWWPAASTSPPPPPPPTVSPPVVPPVTSPLPCPDVTCPTGATLIVRIPGCPEIPIGGPGGGTSPPAVPPGSPPTTPPVVPPTPPPPPEPPPPTLPPGTTTTPLGMFDGPDGCVRVAVGTGATGLIGDALFDSTFGTVLRSPAIVASVIPFLGPAAARGLEDWGRSVTDAVKSVVDQTAKLGGVNNVDVAVTTAAYATVGGFLKQWAGFPADLFLEPLYQAHHYANPTGIPSQAAVDQMHLAGVMNKDQWECYTRMNGNMPWVGYEHLKSQRTRPGVSEAIALYRRRLVDSDGFFRLMREAGVLDRETALQFYSLSTSVPTTTDLFKWLKRDVYNDNFARVFGLDEDFPNPLPAQWQRWLDANGTSPEEVLYEYRSGWELPSKTQTDEFIRRLRPGRVPKDLEFTQADADQLYKLNEVPKGIRPRLLATSYLPINRTDVIESYKAGVMDQAEVTERLQDVGYNKADAVQMTKLIVAKANKQFSDSSGTWTRRRVTTMYLDGSISRDVAEAALRQSIVDEAKVQGVLDEADVIRSAVARGKCIKGIRRRYFTGEFDESQARQALMDISVEQHVIVDLMTGWTCERKSRSKEPTVKMLEGWVTKGIITWREMDRRLLNLGYTQEDAERIRVAVDMDYRERLAREIEAEQRRAEADRRRSERDARRRRGSGDSG